MELALLAGIDASAFSRWKRGEDPRAREAIRFARGTGGNVLEALTVAGYIDAHEADLREVDASLDQFTDVVLLRELLRRSVRRADEVEAAEVGDVLLAWAGGDDAAEADQVASLAARRGVSRGEAARQAQDDDAHG